MKRVKATQCRRGLGMIEATMSIVVVGVMFVSVLNTVGATAVAEMKMANREVAVFLAQDLMAEILQKDYMDPALGTDAIGRSVEEDATGDRSLFDDVDDYVDWSSKPPQFTDGTDIPGLDDYRRIVRVKWVDPNNLKTDSGSATGIKRVKVIVRRNGIKLLELMAFRAVSLKQPVAEEPDELVIK